MGALIDSSVFIAVERGKLNDDILQRGDEPAAISAITVSELLHGVHRASPERRAVRLQYVESILSTFPVIAFDEAVARTHAALIATLTAAGKPVGDLDAIIAATALHLEYGILTIDARSFPRIPGLRCELLRMQ